VTEPTPEREALATAKSLIEGVRALGEEVKGLRGSVHRSWWYIGVDVALTIVLAVVTVIAIHASSDASGARAAASAEHSSLIAACLLGNQTRAQEIDLWDHLAAISKPGPGETKRQIAKGQREVGMLLAYIKATFAPRPCAKLYRS
jgi:hypothetical protein